MKLIEAVNANLAAQEMSQQRLPYDLALAVVKVKRATADETDFFLREERALVEEYADTDENGNIRMTGNGRFALRGSAQEYEKKAQGARGHGDEDRLHAYRGNGAGGDQARADRGAGRLPRLSGGGSEMKLPSIVYQDGIRKGTQVKFGGLNHNLGAGDGELWDMRNMTSDYYPLLASRGKRRLFRTLTKGNGLFSWDALAWADGTKFFYGGIERGSVEDSEKTFCALGAYLIILPDKKYYNTLTGEFGSLESEWAGTSLTFTNGKLFEEEAKANTIQCAGVDWSAYFKAGDAVTISGCTKHTENNKTPVIREIDGDKMYFYEYAFTLDGDKGETPYTESGNMTVRRTVPMLRYICENENRLWGCDDTTIYASKLGDPFNWNVYEGLDTDSYAVDTGSAGKFTGCVSFLGYPIFFKEDHIYKVYGSLPSNFEIMGSATLGVADGSGRSLAIAGETLFYLSRAGIMVYSGGIPQPIGSAFGMDRFKNAVGGSDGLKYYVSMTGPDGELLYVYDTQKGLWHTEDATKARYFARFGGNLFLLNDQGEVWIAGNVQNAPESTEEETVAWSAEFGDFTENDPNKKGVSKLQLRMELEEGAEVQVYLKFDGGEWLKVDEKLCEAKKRSYYLPIVPRRGDHYRLKLEGKGAFRLYSLTREYYSGSELKSTQGRN